MSERELITWLRSQLNEDERVAHAAIAEHDGKASWAIEEGRLLWLPVIDSCDPASMPPGMAEHIARHDPDRVLAEVAAKRRIIDEYERYAAERRRAMGGWDTFKASPIMAALAAVYAGREGWRDEWRVA